MSLRVTDDCIGCGACEFACPTGALTKTDSFLGLFVIDPYLCDDCTLCVDKCPVIAIVADPAWPVCNGRGCPLTSRRLAEVDCALWQQRCAECGTTLWRHGGEEWACPRCGLGLRVRCPKTRSLDAVPTSGTPRCSEDQAIWDLRLWSAALAATIVETWPRAACTSA